MGKNIPESFESWKYARILARSSKRLDICAAQFAMLFHLSNKGDLTHKVCLEVGSGWVLSHAIICYLLGAKHIFATDISPNAHPATLKTAIHGAIPSAVRDTLARSVIMKRSGKDLMDFWHSTHFHLKHWKTLELNISHQLTWHGIFLRQN